MFDRLVVSTVQKRRHRTGKFFLGTVALYALVLACAFVLSILIAEPKLAASERVIWIPPTPPPGPPPPGVKPPHLPTVEPSRPNFKKLMTLDEIAAHQTAGRPPVLPTIPYVGDNEGVQGGLENGVVGGMRNVGAVAGGEKEDNAPPRPDPTKPRPAAQTTVTDSRPVRLISTVLQGKAIARPKPNYPPLARQMRLQGDVSVEVIVSPDGRVEAARVISGHPMFAQCAREAALGWRFEPTILNGVPVRVTGVITFVFKMNE